MPPRGRHERLNACTMSSANRPHMTKKYSRRRKYRIVKIEDTVYSLTDPPIRTVRRALPPLRMGAVALDFGWSIVMLVVIILMSVVRVISVAV
jgi:YggT family protein